MAWYRAAELVHARWAMLGVAGILAQEVVHPEQWWYVFLFFFFCSFHTFFTLSPSLPLSFSLTHSLLPSLSLSPQVHLWTPGEPPGHRGRRKDEHRRSARLGVPSHALG